MAKSESLAVKYRPKGWDAITEQEAVKTILQNQIATNNLKHAYLFSGSAGCGKTTSARIIANIINENAGAPIELDCASHNGIDDVRRIIDECRSKPLIGKYKIFILDECHMLTQAANNGLLKILEEPPEWVIFILCTTDPQKIIGTIHSRVQRLNFQKISNKGIEDRLKYILEQEGITNYEIESIEYIARLVKGGMRDAITTLEKCLDYSKDLTLSNVLKSTSGGINESDLFILMEILLSGNAKLALNKIDEIYMSGIDMSLFVKMFIQFTQDCIKYIITQSAEHVTLSDNVIKQLDDKYFNNINELRDWILGLVNIKTKYASEDIKMLVESWVVAVCN